MSEPEFLKRAEASDLRKWMLVLLLAIVLLSSTVRAATITASSTSYTDVNAAIVSASADDTVIVPDGSATWSTQLTISKPIYLRTANGTNNTIITNGMADGQNLIVINLTANKTNRLSGFQFLRSAANYAQLIAVFGLNSDARRIRIDSNFFNECNQGVLFLDSALGVFDGNTLIAPASGRTAFIGYVKGAAWNGTQGVTSYGDGAWAAADNLGTDNFFFFESNNFSNRYSQALTSIDSQAGGRYVFRYNRCHNVQVDTHGSEARRERSGRAFEIYMNTFTAADAIQTVAYMRGGVGVIWSNTVTGPSTPYFALLHNRTKDSLFSPIGGADGRNPWDANDAGNPFDTSTATSAGTLTVTASAELWTVNQWEGYIVRRTSGTAVSSMTRSGDTVTVNTTGAHGFSTGNYVSIFGADQQPYNTIYEITVVDSDTFTVANYDQPTSPATGTILCCLGTHFSEITANTSTQLTFQGSLYGSTLYLSFTSGDTFEINKLTHGMDQIGRRLGTDLAGVASPSVPGGWNDQTTSPWYEWDNYRTEGGSVDFGVTSQTIVSGTHYNNNTAKPGYTPFTYPHPLVNGGGGGGTTNNVIVNGNARVNGNVIFGQ